jgi:aminoglycoside 3-N-acetyltransferase
MVVMVHTSFRSVGPVEGGPLTLIQALRAAVGNEGTLVMPTHTSNLTDPANWRHPPAPPHTWHGLRIAMRPFDPAHTPVCGMGVVAELFRQMPGTLRSHHPIESVCAQGPAAQEIAARQPWNAATGPDGPLGRLYDLDARVLLIGVNHNRNTSLHLAETLANVPYRLCDRVPVYLHGRIVWQEVWSRAVCGEGFTVVDPILDARGLQVHGLVGQAHARFMRQRAVVGIGVELLRENPLALLCPPGSCVDCDIARDLPCQPDGLYPWRSDGRD